MKNLLLGLFFLLQMNSIKPMNPEERNTSIMDKILFFKDKIIAFKKSSTFENFGALTAGGCAIAYIGFGIYYFHDMATNTYGHPKAGCIEFGKFLLSSNCPNCGKIAKN